MPMAIKPSNAYPNLTTDHYPDDYALGLTCTPSLMKMPLYTVLTIRPSCNQRDWRLRGYFCYPKLPPSIP